MGCEMDFRPQTGPKPTSCEAKVLIGLKSDANCTDHCPIVRVNAVPYTLGNEDPDVGIFTFDVLEDARSKVEHVISTTTNVFTGNKMLKVNRVEFYIGAV